MFVAQFETLFYHQDMRILLLILIFTSLCYSQELTSEADCKETIRLDLLPGVLAKAKIPVQDQADLNICSAMVNSVLIDCWRFVNDPPLSELTSPISLNWQYASAKGFLTPERLDGSEMLKESKNLYSCSQRKIGIKFNSLSPFKFIQEIHSSYSNVKAGQTDENAALMRIRACLNNAGINSQLQIVQLREYLQSKTAVDFANKLFLDMCSDSKTNLSKLPETETKFATEFGKDRIAAQNYYRKLLNERLSKPNSQPVGINFCRKVFSKPDFVGVLSDGTLSNNVGCVGDNHYGSVVGRRLLSYKEGNETKKICQFLIRDSYGDICNEFPDDPTTEPQKRCENGAVWVDENMLTANIGRTYYLKDKKK